MPTVDELKAEANTAYAAKDYSSAVKLYTRALDLDPTNHVLLSNRSAAYVGLEQFSKALDDANACLKSRPDFVKGYSRKAYAHLQLKQPGFAEAAYREGLTRDKHNTVLKQGLEAILKEDGDQSSRSNKAKNDQQIRNSMARVGEDFPYHLARESNQPLTRALCDANLQRLQAMFKPELLSYRATPNFLPITSFVVALAQRTKMPSAEAMPAYCIILEWLLDKGARVDARDIGGYTALGHAAAHTPVLPLAEVLLRKGADVNQRNRFGSPVLISAVMAAEEEAVDLLLKWGADPDLRDNDGICARQLARFHPKMLASMDRKQGVGAEAVQQYSHNCGQCGKSGAVKRCSKCRLVIYCSADCQKAHWSTHKLECKEKAKQQLRVEIKSQPPGGGGQNSWSGMSASEAARWTSGHLTGTRRGAQPQFKTINGNIAVKHDKLFDVKIQVPKSNDLDSIPPEVLAHYNMTKESFEQIKKVLPEQTMQDLMCYNQKRDFQCWIPREQNDSEKLVRLIKTSGLAGGLKAYFKAFVDQTTKQLVVLPMMLPAQPW